MDFGLDLERLNNLDCSVILNYPETMSGVQGAMIDILNKKRKIVIEHSSVDVSLVRDIVQKSTGDLDTYHLIPNASPKVWSILREPVNQDRVRVLGVFHGSMPEALPDNKILIDVGRSLRKATPRGIVSSLTEALTKGSSKLRGSGYELFTGLQTLCYEVLYSPEARTFPRSVANNVPRAIAFKFMYNPPEPPTEAAYMSAVTRFIEDVT